MPEALLASLFIINTLLLDHRWLEYWAVIITTHGPIYIRNITKQLECITQTHPNKLMAYHDWLFMQDLELSWVPTQLRHDGSLVPKS